MDLEEARRKTDFIMGFPVLKRHILEGPSKDLNQFVKDIKAFAPELEGGLSPDEINKLRYLKVEILDGGIIIFHPELPQPVIGYNLDNVQRLFSKPGWLFHATVLKTLKSISHDGQLLSPVESIIEKKRYMGDKYQNQKSIKRIMDGISFAYQDAIKYQSYRYQADRKHSRSMDPEGTGSFLIFPLTEALEEGQVLMFGGMDGYPEICLQDPKYWEIGHHLHYLLFLKEDCNGLLRKQKDTLKLFELCRHNKDRLAALGRAQENGMLKDTPIEHKGTIYFMKKEARNMDPNEENMAAYQLMTKEKGADYAMGYERRLRLAMSDEEEYQRLYQELDDYKGRAKAEYLKSQTFMSGDDELLKILYKNHMHLRPEYIYRPIEEDDYFSFMLYFKASQIDVPHLFEMTARLTPRSRQGSLGFKEDEVDYSFRLLEEYEEKIINTNDMMPVYMISFWSRKRRIGAEQAISGLKQMKPTELYKIVQEVRTIGKRTIDAMMPFARTKHPVRVDIRKGVLFMTNKFQERGKNSRLIEQLIKRKVPILAAFHGDHNDEIPDQIVVSAIHNILGGQDLPFNKHVVSQEYFYCQGTGEGKEIFLFEDGSGHRVI
ncbi:MAG: hypothetical protein KJ709_05690 [Nanoarchaeota archaeon]|nr:hypothetical protein [Nanoarchaeota archaeon]